MAELKDSGARKEFGTGAVRDADNDSKGRCDLLPLAVISGLGVYRNGYKDTIFSCIHDYIYGGNPELLLKAVDTFISIRYPNTEDAILELSIHFKDGANKYAERNWEKGIPLSVYINSAVRHFLKYLRGDIDEPHDRAFLWNLMCAVHTHLFLSNKLKDLPFNQIREK